MITTSWNEGLADFSLSASMVSRREYDTGSTYRVEASEPSDVRSYGSHGAFETRPADMRVEGKSCTFRVRRIPVEASWDYEQATVHEHKFQNQGYPLSRVHPLDPAIGLFRTTTMAS